MSERVDVSAVHSGRRLRNQIIFNPIKMSRSLEKKCTVRGGVSFRCRYDRSSPEGDLEDLDMLFCT